MRVDFTSHTSSHAEARDAIDQNWYAFCRNCDLFPVLIPNDMMLKDPNYLSFFIQQHELNGLIFSGGNTLHSLGGDSENRDFIEKAFLNFAITNKIPVIGVCRGMQIIQEYFGINLYKIDNHVAQNHEIIFQEKKILVNSFHNFGTDKSIPSLKVKARSHDQIIEAISHETLPIQGIMWHPERYSVFSKLDLRLFNQHFHNKAPTI